MGIFIPGVELYSSRLFNYNGRKVSFIHKKRDGNGVFQKKHLIGKDILQHTRAICDSHSDFF